MNLPFMIVPHDLLAKKRGWTGMFISWGNKGKIIGDAGAEIETLS
jgi:hypothetical protein